jgi:hypothetical protein
MHVCDAVLVAASVDQIVVHVCFLNDGLIPHFCEHVAT